jgi:hypothetical protein
MTTLLAEVSPITSSFPQFSRLPPELRETIWKYALPEGRILCAAGHCAVDDWVVLNLSDFEMPLAYVCSESRRVVQESGYRLCYELDGIEYGTGIWFCEGRDGYDLGPDFMLMD